MTMEKRNLTEVRAQKALYCKNIRDLLMEGMEVSEVLIPQFEHEDDLFFIADNWCDIEDIMNCLKDSWAILQDIAKEEEDLLQKGKEIQEQFTKASIIFDDCQSVLDMNPCQEVMDAISDLYYTNEYDMYVYSQKLADILGDEYVDFDLVD